MIIRSAVDRPVTVFMLFAGLVLVGILALQRLPVDLLPAINYPNLTVITTCPDTPPEDLSRLVTQPLEEVITGLAGVRRVTSRTREGVSTITVEYDWGQEMDFANLHLREALDRVAFREDFPSDADRPLILRWDPGARPIAVLALAGNEPLAEATEFAREVLKPALEQIQGISQAEVIGGAEREVLVRPDFSKMSLYGLTMEELRAALQLSNISFPGGRIRRGPLHLPLRILGEFESLDDVRNTEVPGHGLTIGHIAAVIDTLKEPEGITLLGDRQVVSLHLYKEVGANTVTATKEVDRVLEVLSQQYPSLSYTFVYRDDRFVKESFGGLRDSLVSGGLLAFVVLFLFLQDFRSPIVIGLAIPVSVFATFAFLYFARVNLNLMSLGGLSLAAGMLVDNSIVVLENINRRLREHARWPDAVADVVARSTREVALPVIASTLTTIAVFFPVIYVPGIAGEFFRDQALTVTCALLLSVLSALLLQPVFSARVLAPPSEPKGLFRIAHALVERLTSGHRRMLETVLARKGRFMACLGAALLVAGATALTLRSSFLPPRNQGDFAMLLELRPGTPLVQTEEVAAGLCRSLQAMNEVATVYAQIGQTERTVAALKEYTAAHTARIRVMLHPARDSRRRMEAVKSRLRENLGAIPAATYLFRDEGVGLREILAGSDTPFTLGIVAENLEDAMAVTADIMPRLEGIPGLTDLETDRIRGAPTVVLSVDREKALRLGLEPDAVTRELRSRIQGTVATSFDEVEQRIDIAVRLPRDTREDLDAVLLSPVALGGGVSVPLGTFVTRAEECPMREVIRRDQRPQITIRGDVRGRALGAVWRSVRRIIEDVPMPRGAAFVTAGEQDEMVQSFRDMGWALLLSAVLIYMILAAQFESFIDPLIISAILPVGAMGSVFTLRLTGQSLNIMSLIGLIALLGIAVNNAIVKVAAIRQLREEGMSGRAAVLEASRIRLRPILMTTVTTVLALIPMAIGLGTGDQMQRPLAIVILGGLSFSTALTLFMTPVLYELIHQRLDPDYGAPAASGSAGPGSSGPTDAAG